MGTSDRDGDPQQGAVTGEPGPPATAAPSSAESRRARAARHGRRARLYAIAIVFVALLVVLVALAAANDRTVRLDWIAGSTDASLVWVILAATVLGWLLGIIMSALFRFRTRRPR
jgi:uncharacterized integral membrane protein